MVSSINKIILTIHYRKGENVSTNEVAEVINSFPGIEESNVYGVVVPGHEGRCGKDFCKEPAY
jgi:hypothetical protein